MSSVATREPRNRRGRDYRAAACFPHFRDRVFDPKKNAPSKYREGPIPIFHRRALYRAGGSGEAGVVVNDVEFPELLHRAGHQCLDVAFGSYIGFLKDRHATILATFADRRSAALLVQIGNDD